MYFNCEPWQRTGKIASKTKKLKNLFTTSLLSLLPMTALLKSNVVYSIGLKFMNLLLP
jgi:hypothetical protein